jgi:hypothetical protein
MLKRLLPLALLLSIAVVGIWLATRGGEEGASERGAVSAVSPGGAPAAPESARSAPRLVDAPVGEIGGAAKAGAAAPRTLAASEYEAELAEGTWIEGRVVFPPDTPADERVRVVANGLSFEHGPDHAVDVRADGRFKVALSKRTRTGRLELEATYLYLDEPLKVDTRAKLSPVVLEPRLGGAMHGRVVPPPDDPDAAQKLVGRSVKLTASRQVDANSWRSSVRDSFELDASLEFAFHGLPIDGRFELGLDPQVYEPVKLDDLFAHAGIVAEYVLEVLPGVTLAGVLRDETGEPVNAQVTAQVEMTGSWSPGAYRSAMSKDGAFRLEGITPGKTKLTVQAKGYEDRELDLGVLARGETRDALELVLSRGNAIRGVVLLPDGTPAGGALITTETEDGETSWNLGGGVRAAEDGSFTVTGLESGAYRVSASYAKKERVTVTSELTGRERERTVTTTLRTAVTGIEAGRGGLVLRVSAGEVLAGSVVDDAGGALDQFSVRYGRLVDAGQHSWVRDEKGRRFRDANGVFEVDGLEPGTWRVWATADGYLDSQRVEVEVPGRPLAPLRMTRAAFVGGVVLDPGGDPVRDATIEVRGDGPDGGMFAGLGYVSMGERGFRWQGNSGADGRFKLDSVRPGKVVLRASAGGHAPSAPLELAIAPGGRVEDVALQLTLGLRLTGLVVDSGGKGLAHRVVTLDRHRGPRNQSVQTDAAGAFAFAGIEPGEYRVSTRPTPAELAAAGLTGMDGIDAMLERQAKVQVGPSDGYVVLRPADLAPVRLFGVVTAGGRPAQGRLYIYSAGGGQGVSATLDERGEYSVALPEPRVYNVSVHLGSDSSLQRAADLTGRTELRLDIDIPIGRIEGRVLGPEGPLHNMAVNAQRSLDERGEKSWAYANAQTDRAGRYAFEDLPAGTWRVSAGGHNGFGGKNERYLAEAVLDGLVVTSGGQIRNADLQLSAAGAIAGRVVAENGAPVAGVRIFVRTAEGGATNDLGFHSSRDGAFLVAGLDPGTVYVSAAGSGHATARDVEVAVHANETANVEVKVAGATVLHVRTFGADGAPRNANVAVLRDGVDQAFKTDWELNQGLSAGERRFGPYPPGTYQVSASVKGASAPARTVKLNGEAEVEIELRLE